MKMATSCWHIHILLKEKHTKWDYALENRIHNGVEDNKEKDFAAAFWPYWPV